MALQHFIFIIMKEALTSTHIQQFIQQGFVRIDNAFRASLAEEARAILWKDIDADANNPATWTKPVVRLGMYTQEPFVKAANTPVLHNAFDQLAGKNSWLPCRAMGAFPVRFPSATDPGDTGWHVDAGFPGADPTNFFEWRINIHSKGRALLMLFLFSDVGELDAPTRLRIGSHIDVAKVLAPEGEAGLSFMELASKTAQMPTHEEALATGKAGTVYLCHPFMVHSAQQHHGTVPKFMAQPPLLLKDELMKGSPVWESIAQAL